VLLRADAKTMADRVKWRMGENPGLKQKVKCECIGS